MLKENCICCKCVDASSSAMFSEKTATSYNTATDDDCSCNSCSCSEISSNQTVNSAKKCTCLNCVCPICPNKPTKQFTETVTQVGDTAANELTKTTCSCKKCVCLVCPSKTTDINTAKASQTIKQTTDKGTGEGIKCECSISTNRSKAKVELATQVTNCTCSLQTSVTNKEEKKAKECKCTICPDLSQFQPGLIKESVNCYCTECKCNPCGDPKKNQQLDAAKVSVSSDDCQCPDLDKIVGDIFKIPTTCFCNPCKCNPCDDPTKMEPKENVAQRPDNFNVDANKMENSKSNVCGCTFCSDPSKLNADVVNKLVVCNCIQCACNPCADVEKGKQIQDQKTEDNGVECINDNCDCDPCLDSNKNEKKTSNIGFQIPQRMKCNCSTCTCNYCNDHKLEIGKGDQDNKGQPANEICQCTTCACEDSKKSSPPSDLCYCPICKCNPCNDTKTMGNIGEQPTVCYCPVCHCESCADPTSKQTTKKDTKVERIGDEEPCLCEPCPCKNDNKQEDSNKSSPPSDLCYCPICKCTPCNDTKIAGNIGEQPTLCYCPVCHCESCADPTAQQTTKKDTKVEKIGDEESCLCDPCSCNNNNKQLTPNKWPCDCPVCYCQPCGDNNIKGRDIAEPDENINMSQQKGDANLGCGGLECRCLNCNVVSPVDGVDCKCEPCTYSDCDKKTTVVESIPDQGAELQSFPTDELPKYQCKVCKCGQFYSNKEQDEQQKQLQRKDIIDDSARINTGEKPNEDVKLDIQNEKLNICICNTCDCPNEEEGNNVNTACICERCSNPTCLYKTEGKLSAAACRCNPCTCVECSTKIVKADKEVKQLDTSGDKNVCLCSPCQCVGCMFVNKNCRCKNKEPIANAPALEFKCTCPGLTMGRPKDTTVTKPDINKFINPPEIECKAKANCISYRCHGIVTNHNFQKFEIPTRLQSPCKDRPNRFELESLFKSPPERMTTQKRKKKLKSPELEQFRPNLPPYSELLLPQAKNKKPTEHVGSMSEQIKNYMIKCSEKYCEMNTGHFSKLDKYTENIKIIKKSLRKIKSYKEGMEKNSKESRSFSKTTSDFVQTMSELGIAFDYLKKNFKPDDEIIKSITKEIKRYTSSTTFNKLEKHDFVQEQNDIQSFHDLMRISVPTIPVLQPATVSVRPTSAAPGQHRSGQVCHCSVCTRPSPNLICHSGDTTVNHKQSKLVRTINYERAVSDQKFNTKDSGYHFISHPDRSPNYTTNFDPGFSSRNLYQSQMKQSETAVYNIYEGESLNSSETINPILVKQASSFEHTLSDLRVAVNTLEAKCRAKDRIIEETTHKLKKHLSSSILVSMMNRIEGIPSYVQADEEVVTKKSVRNAETQIDRSAKDKKGVPCKCGRIHKDNKHVSLSGFRVVNIKRITVDSIIIEWKAPRSKSITGYEIEINGERKSKIMSGWRTCAMVHSVEMSEALNISIYAITPCGRCYPPARAIYEIKRKAK